MFRVIGVEGVNLVGLVEELFEIRFTKKTFFRQHYLPLCKNYFEALDSIKKKSGKRSIFLNMLITSF